jgi:hypothetical protein
MKRTSQLKASRGRVLCGMAAVELLMAIGVMFSASWFFLQVGVVGYQLYLEIIAQLVTWPIG